MAARIRHYSAQGWTAVADWAGVPLRELAKACGENSFDAPSFHERGY